MDSMNSMVMMLLILGIIYVAFTYLKGPANSDKNRNDPGTGMPFGPRGAGGEMWNDNAPELPQNDEMEMEPDGEDMEVIRYEDEAEEDAPDAEAVNAAAAGAFAVKMPAAEAGTESQSAPAASMPETPADFGAVTVDSEVHIDADMSSDRNE